MRKIKTLLAIMVLVLMASLCAPQAFAGVIHNPVADGDMSGPGLAGEILTPPGAAGETPTPGVNGEMQNGITGDIGFPGLDGQMEFPVAGSIWAIIAGLF